ncbi:MAG TPA: alpha-amylase family glycosyl hydrolase [Bacteroidales bacterium]
MIKKSISTFLLLVAAIFIANAQSFTVDPTFPVADGNATIILNTEGTGYSGDIYAHTGITINGNRWQNVIGSWGNNNNQPKFTKIGEFEYTLEITPSIRQFYNASAGDNITEMCFVFRSADATWQTEDLFYDVYLNELNVLITNPTERPYIVQLNDIIQVTGNSNNADSTFLFIDNVQIYGGTENSFSENIIADTYGKHWIKAVAKTESNQVADSTYFYVRPAAEVAELPEGTMDGINYIDDNTVVLSLYAPGKEYVFAIGDFNDWDIDDAYYAKVTPDGKHFWVELTGLEAGKEYIFQYFVDGTIRIGDPYADKVSDPWNDKYISNATYPNLIQYPNGKTDGVATVFQTAQEDYQWEVENFTPPAHTDMVIYEMLIRDFIETHTYNDLIDTLDYFQRLGVNVIELMPPSEFEGNLSWGYNPNYYFAPDKYYGPKNTMKKFIDECHKRGIAVVQDMVLNHAYGTNAMAMLYWDSNNNRPAADNPWFNVNSPNPVYSWGSDFNHESQATKDFVDRVNRYWVEEYKVDGFRFDFTKGFTNTPGDGGGYDQSRIDILKRMSDAIWDVNPDTYVILEHFAANSEEKVLSDYGMMIWGNLNYNYNEATMGWNDGGKSDFSGVSYKSRGWSQPNLVGYMESHDEERLMAKNLAYGNSSGSYNIKELNTALGREELAGVFFFTIPGPKMIWQFGEVGYDYNINYPGAIGGDEHRVDEKPIRWDYYEDYNRRNIFNVWSEVIKLKKTYNTFRTTNYTMSVSGIFKRIVLNDPEMSAVVIGNFGVETGDIDPQFPSIGTWYDYFTGDSLVVTNVNQLISLNAGQYKLYTDKKLTKPDYVGIGENEQPSPFEKATIYPNPASNTFSIILDLKESSNTTIELYDLQGRKIKELYSGHLTTGQQQIKAIVNDIKPGMYLVMISNDGQKLVKKLLIN